MIENLADNAIANLLRACVPTLIVVPGLADNEPELETPVCVVWSVVEEVTGKKPISKLKTTVEYLTISGQDAAADVVATMTAIDAALTAPPTEVVNSLPPSGLSFLSWEHIPRTNQEAGDRRRTLRELTVWAS